AAAARSALRSFAALARTQGEQMETIGDYQLVRLLGEGGMGKVYEAEEELSKRRVALKVLRPELARLESARRLFLNEMTVMAKLDHPNIVRGVAFRARAH